MENENLNDTSKINTKNIIAAIVIVIIFLGLLFVTFSYFNSPKKKLIDTINNIYSKLLDKESNKKISNILNNNVIGLKGETEVNISGIDDVVEKFNNIKLSYDYKEDKNLSKASLNVDSSISNQKLIAFYSLIKDNKIYFKLKNIIDKFYYLECNFNSLLTSNDDDIKYISNIVKEEIISNIDDDNFSKAKTTIKIDNKDTKVEKIGFEFSDKLIDQISIDILTRIQKDDKSINIISKYVKDNKENINKQLTNIINNIKENTSDQKYTLNMYVKDYSNIVKYELVIDNTSIEYFKYKNTEEFIISDMGINYFDLKINDNKDISGEFIGGITFKGTYDENKIDLKINYQSIICNLIIENSETFKTDSLDINTTIKVNVSQFNQDYFKITINSKNTLSKEEKIDEESIKSSIDFNSISDKDKEIIKNKIMGLPIFNELNL